MRTSGRVAVVIFAIATLPLAAQTKPREFGSGPAQWLFTPDDRKAWRSVQTDDQAIEFIDLFWARRDPTPGTPRNENRLEFENRVRYADQNFGEPRVRGALTERGRVIILLGFPANWNIQNKTETKQMTDVQGFDPNDPTGGRMMAAKDTWNYSYEQAEKFGMPKIEVVWIHDRIGELVRRDPLRTDFTMALPAAIKSWIVSPQLTSVPEWASSRMTSDVVMATETVTETTLERVKKGQTVVITAPEPVAKPAGAGKLILLSDASVLQPESGNDPFAVASLKSFRRAQDLGWAAEYCSGAILENAPTVRVELKLAGGDGTISSEPENFVPDSIKASPGCYLVRGSIPLADVEPGAHQLTITISARDQSYNLSRELVVE